MGLSILTRERRNAAPATEAADPAHRYHDYFPRLFAYVRSCLGDEPDRALEIVASAFCDALDRCSSAPEPEFRFALFRAARRLCRSALKSRSAHRDGLTPRERELLSLTFEARLTRGEISRLCGIREPAAANLLMAALQKLRTQPSSAVTPAQLRAAHPWP